MHRLRAGDIAAVDGVGIVAQGCIRAGMAQAMGDGYYVYIVGEQDCGVTMPLRYNYDKPEKPRISRVFGYLARFFILFQTEKSSREVVIS